MQRLSVDKNICQMSREAYKAGIFGKRSINEDYMKFYIYLAPIIYLLAK